MKEAEEGYLKAIELEPNYAQAYHGLGLLMDKLGKYNDAIKYFDSLIDEAFNIVNE